MRAAERKKRSHQSVATPSSPRASGPHPVAAFARRHGGRILALWALALVAYANSFQAGLIYDNSFAIGQDVRIREATASNVRLILTQDYWFGRTDARLYRPLTTLSYLFNYAVLRNGPNPRPYHWINFVLHAVNIALVYLLALVLLAEIPLAFAAAALWAVHPVLTESITNIVGRADLLAALGVLAGLLCHIQGAASAGKRKFQWLAGLAAASAVAVFSKENGIMLLAAMALYDFLFRSGPVWRARIAGYIAAAAPVLLFLLARARVLAGIVADPIAFTDNPLSGAGFWTAKLTALQVLVKYLGLLVWPLRLSSDYSYNQVSLVGWGDWQAFASLAILIAVLLVAGLCWRRAPAVSWFILFFFAVLAPTANLLFPIGTIMAERFLYLPAIAAAGCAVLAWKWAADRWTRLRSSGPVLLALVCAALAVRTWARNADWADDAGLWTSAEQAAPNSYKPHFNVSVVDGQAHGNYDEAIREADRSIAILNALPDVRNISLPYANAAQWRRVKGDALTAPAAKSAQYAEALQLLERARRIDQARSRLLGRDFGTTLVYAELGRIYERMSQPREAIQILEFGRHVAQSDEICEQLAGLYQDNGQLERAAVTYMEALSLSSDPARVAAKLAALYRQLDPQGCALVKGTLNLACPLVHQHVCTAARNVVRLYGTHRAAAENVRSEAIRNLGCPAEMFSANASD